jgi:hypothetical protein
MELAFAVDLYAGHPARADATDLRRLREIIMMTVAGHV